MSNIPDFFNADDDFCPEMNTATKPRPGWYQAYSVKQGTGYGKKNAKWPYLYVEFEALKEEDDPNSAAPIAGSRPRMYISLPFVNPEADDPKEAAAKRDVIGRMAVERLQGLMGDDCPQPPRWDSDEGSFMHQGERVSKKEKMELTNEAAKDVLELVKTIWGNHTAGEYDLVGHACYMQLTYDSAEARFPSVKRITGKLPRDAELVPADKWAMTEAEAMADAA